MEQSVKTDYPVSFHGQGKEFFRIWIVNVLLSVVTLGIYSAWAKVRTKKYFYGNTELDEHTFDYHAEPKQILKGRIIAAVCVLVWAIASNFFPSFASLLMIAFYLFIPVLIRGNARFDAAMTSYRNVRFSFAGSLKDAYISYLGRPLGVLLLTMLLFTISSVVFADSTGGGIVMALICIPVALYLFCWVIAGMARYLVNHYQYGEHNFSADLSARYFFITYLMAFGLVVAALVVIGGITFAVASSEIHQIMQGGMIDDSSPFAIGALVYASLIIIGILTNALIRVRVRNYVFANTAIHLSKTEEEAEPEPGELQLQSAMTVGAYLWLVVTNFLAQLVTLGLARPWVLVRTQTYLAGVTSLNGDLSQLKATDQDSAVKSAVADEVAQAFDLELGL